jgi:RNA polymerase-binding transcription factor DksA
VPDQERARILTAVETELADVEFALARLDAGTYDRCEVCDRAIDDGTLAANAAARRCAVCSAST